MEVVFQAASRQEVVDQDEMLVLEAEPREGYDVLVAQGGDDLDFQEEFSQRIFGLLQDLHGELLAVGETALIDPAAPSLPDQSLCNKINGVRSGRRSLRAIRGSEEGEVEVERTGREIGCSPGELQVAEQSASGGILQMKSFQVLGESSWFSHGGCSRWRRRVSSRRRYQAAAVDADVARRVRQRF